MAKSSFRWAKKGLIFRPDGRFEWMQTHAQNPSVLILEDRLRVYFSCRPDPDPAGDVSAVTTFLDLQRNDPGKVIYVHDRPILALGELGTFDQFGMMPGSVIRTTNEVWLYYVGWMRTRGAPYAHAIGLAIGDDVGTHFRRVGRGPLFGMTPAEPYLQNSPCVFRQGDLWHMWYSSGVDWVEDDGRAESIYLLMHASSLDGINWQRDGTPCMPTELALECQTSPTVMKVSGRWYMWFCYRWGLGFRNPERGYRIGFAWSDDLKTWQRDDSAGALHPAPEGWDSEMVCYPSVLNVDGNTYMFYSGNDFGRAGFGYALLSAGDGE